MRLAVKLDFITALLKKSLECTGTEFRGAGRSGEVAAPAQYVLGAERLRVPKPRRGVNGAYLPDHAALQTYRVMAPRPTRRLKHHRTQRHQRADSPAIQRTGSGTTRRSISIWRSTCAAPTVWITSNAQDFEADVGCHR